MRKKREKETEKAQKRDRERNKRKGESKMKSRDRNCLEILSVCFRGQAARSEVDGGSPNIHHILSHEGYFCDFTELAFDL